MKSRQQFFPLLLLWLGVVVLWGLYRFFFHMAEWVEELVLKPAVFVLPVISYLAYKNQLSKDALGMWTNNPKRILMWGIGLGAFLIAETTFVSLLKGKHFIPSAFLASSMLLNLIISAATAFSEEILYRGLLLERIQDIWKKEYTANFFVAFLFMIGHVGQAVFVLHYPPYDGFIYLLTIFINGFASGFIYQQTKSVYASTLSHAIWNFGVGLVG